MIKWKKLPVHRLGQTFDSFRELFFETSWVKVRRIIRYSVDVPS